MAVNLGGLITESPLSQRVPKIKPTHDNAKDFVLEQQRAAFISTIDILWAYPKHRQAARDFLLARLKDEAVAKQIDDEGLFDTKVKFLSKVPDDWVCAWLATRCNLTMGVLGRIRAFDSQQVQHLWLFELGASGQMKLPEACNSKEILGKVATKRAHLHGDMLKKVEIAKHVDANGKINWARAGEYVFEHDAKTGVMTSMCHRPSATQVLVPDGLIITLDFEVKDNWSSSKAALKKGPSNYKCIDFFEDKVGPKSAEWKSLAGESEVWNILTNETVDEVNRAKKARADEEVKVDYEALNQPLKERQKEATKRAREALEKHKEEMSKRRKVTVGQATRTT